MRVPRKDTIAKETKRVLAQQFRKVSRELADIHETYRNVVAEKCAGDEVHCSCVPALRGKIDELKSAIEWALECGCVCGRAKKELNIALPQATYKIPEGR